MPTVSCIFRTGRTGGAGARWQFAAIGLKWLRMRAGKNHEKAPPNVSCRLQWRLPVLVLKLGQKIVNRRSEIARHSEISPRIQVGDHECQVLRRLESGDFVALGRSFIHGHT